MKRALVAGETLTDNARVLVDEDGHQAIRFPRLSQYLQACRHPKERSIPSWR
jgi:hypothetical protein